MLFINVWIIIYDCSNAGMWKTKKIREELHVCAFINFVNFFLSVIGKTKTLLKTIIQKQDSGRLVWVG